MNVDQYISSGILELFAALALPPEEMKEVAEAVEKYPKIKEELDAITEGLKKYASLYDPGRSGDLYENIIGKINSATVHEPISEKVAAPVIQINREAEAKEVKSEDKKQATPYRRDNARGYMMLIAASILLLLVSVGVNLYLYLQYNDVKGQLAEMQVEKNALVNDANITKAKVEETENHLKLYTDSNNKMVMMKGMPISPGSEAVVMWNAVNKEVYVDVHHLPVPAEGMQYQLWAIDADGKPIDAGMITSTNDEKAKQPQQMKKVMKAVAFAITLEKRGGSPAPTMDQMYVKGGV